MLDEDANVFKLVGPILAKQTLFDAKSTVKSRIDFITAESTRLEA